MMFIIKYMIVRCSLFADGYEMAMINWSLHMLLSTSYYQLMIPISWWLLCIMFSAQLVIVNINYANFGG